MALRALKHLVYFLGYGACGLVIAVIAVYRWHLDSLPELKIWHTAHLTAEFRAKDDTVRTIADYRALEERLLAQLKREVYDHVPSEEQRRFNRYSSGSLSDPLAQPINWNRTFELSAAEPHAGILLLHGLSDSPYSVRALAERLHARGYHVVGLRMPGHGTAPSGLVHVRWQDMAAAVRLAARDLSQRLGPGKKLHVIGYSNGAALAMEYALSRLQGEALPAVDRLVLISPAIGVSPAAAFAVWLGRLSALFGAPKLAWTDIVPEYDPYKYASFPVNAADQSYALTQVIAARMAAFGKPGGVAGLPRILAFQSVADDTVSTPAVIQALFHLLAPEGHELILFDINRQADATEFYLPGIPEVRERLLKAPPLTFEVTLVTNPDSVSHDIALLHKKAVTGEISTTAITMKWPAGVFSLSHVALPFSPDDPIYGVTPPREKKVVYLGLTELRGERGVLAVAPGSLIRLRHNPFFDYLEGRIESFLSDASAR